MNELFTLWNIIMAHHTEHHILNIMMSSRIYTQSHLKYDLTSFIIEVQRVKAVKKNSDGKYCVHFLLTGLGILQYTQTEQIKYISIVLVFSTCFLWVNLFNILVWFFSLFFFLALHFDHILNTHSCWSAYFLRAKVKQGAAVFTIFADFAPLLFHQQIKVS